MMIGGKNKDYYEQRKKNQLKSKATASKLRFKKHPQERRKPRSSGAMRLSARPANLIAESVAVASNNRHEINVFFHNRLQ